MNVIAIMLKVPELGAVKTRLADSLGESGALEAYRDLVEFLLSRMGDSPFIHIHYTPDKPGKMRDWLGPRFQYSVQRGSDLGERLVHAMTREFSAGAEKLIFLGGDCPYVDQPRLDMAFAALNAHDVVIGPATDGGYYLIGIKHNRPELFQGIDWGRETVCEATLAICKARHLSVSLLPGESDVDDLPSWKVARKFMAEGQGQPPGDLSI